MKKIWGIIFILISILCLASCNKSGEYLMYEASKEKVNLRDYQDSSELDIFLEKLDAFANKLTIETFYDKLNKGELDLSSTDNYCISPISVYMALAMAIECSNGNTRNEILSAVGVTYEEVAKFTEYLYTIANNERCRTDGITNAKKLMYFEQLANSIWIDEKVELKPVGLENLANLYHCSSYHAPFSTDKKSASKAVNDYIKEMTKGLIDPKTEYSKDTLFLLINTYYIKDVWNDEGDDLSFTKDKYDFKEYDNDIEKINLLEGYYKSGKVFEGIKYKQFYTETDNGNSITFVVPNDGVNIKDVYTLENLNTITSTKYQVVNEEEKLCYQTRCLFPEYKTEFDGDLKDVFKEKLGVKVLFEHADLSNITDEDVYCEGIYHKTKLIVDKTGIEGAAVTIMAMCAEAAPDETYTKVYYDFVVDRDFIFIMKNRYDITLFSGIITEI